MGRGRGRRRERERKKRPPREAGKDRMATRWENESSRNKQHSKMHSLMPGHAHLCTMSRHLNHSLDHSNDFYRTCSTPSQVNISAAFRGLRFLCATAALFPSAQLSSPATIPSSIQEQIFNTSKIRHCVI